MKLAVQDRGLFGESFKEKLLKVKEYGFEGLEISGDVLINRFDEIKRALVIPKFLSVPSVAGIGAGLVLSMKKRDSMPFRISGRFYAMQLKSGQTE
jgi:hypothetical protein